MFSVQVASQLPQDLLFVDAEINAYNNVINKFLQTVSEYWQMLLKQSQNGRLSQAFKINWNLGKLQKYKTDKSSLY